jgi:predicted nucleic acid-binding protein
MSFTIDASVFVAAARAGERYHAVSLRFLEYVEENARDVFCPALVLPECAAAIARPTDDEVLAAELVALIESFPRLQLVSVSPVLGRRAAEIAATHRLRGADSVYVAVAEDFNTVLVTWDMEMLNRGAPLVQTTTPEQFLADLEEPG